MVFQEIRASQPERASTDLNEILPAAFGGRVETLFVADDIESWGHYDARASVALLHDERRPGDFDLIDCAAAETLIRHGQIYALAHRNVPGGEQIAAIFRY